MRPQIDGEQLLYDLETLAQFGAEPGPGLMRVAFSPADWEARAWIDARMTALGMTVRRDAAGNSIGLYPGSDPDLPPLILGSHTDTVPHGGRYDGALGVLAALACVRALREAGAQTRHPLEVINFTAEEATMAGGTLGSQAMSGQLDPAIVRQAAWDGRPVGEHLTAVGLDPVLVTQDRRSRGEIAAYLELHIEQGGILEQTGTPVGVVEGIVGIRRYRVVFNGVANHAGTTPMDRRQDALVMAAPFILAVRRVAIDHKIVGTIGNMVIEPGAPNVIPGRVSLEFEIRGLNETTLDQAAAELARRTEAAGGQFAPLSHKAAVASDPRLLQALVNACQSLNLPYHRMPSGAGHDAMCMADIAPQVMLFVPSKDGISHAPAEYTSPEDCVTGARVLLAALLEVDGMLSASR